MEKRLILRGVIAGAVAGLLAFVFARIFAEPVINTAISYESARDAAQDTLDKAAGLPVEAAGPDIFSRTVQASIGIGVGMVFFGIAMGALFAVVYAICLGRVGKVRPRNLALLVAGFGFLGIYLVPFVKYPANPPSIGHPDTIHDRGNLYLVMVLCSVVFLAGAVVLGKKLQSRFGNWNATLLAGAAFAINCLVEQKIDAKMRRTSWRPSARGEITTTQILLFSAVLGGLGMWTLYTFANPLTMWLTLATFVGYAVIYTLLLKPATPQNIVIGGASGAMPPALGWAAVTGHVPGDAWILVLIIFVWTPPHFWALALYRRKDYENAGLPMLPNTHGEKYTRLHILLYTVILFAVTLMPFISGMSGVVYLAAAVLLGAVFLAYAWKIYREYSDDLARRTFRYSIVYLSLLFAALLIDHYARVLIGA